MGLDEDNVITHIIAGGAAHEIGMLQVGDSVLAVNGIKVSPEYPAKNVFLGIEVGNAVQFIIGRGTRAAPTLRAVDVPAAHPVAPTGNPMLLPIAIPVVSASDSGDQSFLPAPPATFDTASISKDHVSNTETIEDGDDELARRLEMLKRS